MTNPFMPQAPAPAAPQPQGNPFAPQQPQQAPPVQPQYTQQPAQQPQQQPQAYPNNGGSPWPQGATAGGPGLVAQPGQFSTPPPPSASGQGGQPRVADLQGRLLIVLPESIQRGVPSRYLGQNGQAQTQDRLTATVIVHDGGPLAWFPKANGQTMAQRTENVPYVIKAMWIQQTKLIEQLEEPLRLRLQGQPGIALGRLWKAGPGANDPYVMAPPNPQDVALYDQYVSQVNPFAV